MELLMKKLALLTLLSAPLAFAAAERDERVGMPASAEVIDKWQEIIGENEEVRSVQHNEALGTVVVRTINKPDNCVINIYVYQNNALIDTIHQKQPWTTAQFEFADRMRRQGDPSVMKELMKRSFKEKNSLRPRNAELTLQEYSDTIEN